MRILVLAGTTEARVLLGALGAAGAYDVRASLAGAVREPADLGVPTRIGGFGGAAGFADYIKNESIDLVLDATHPFAAVMSQTAASQCHAAGVAHAILTRPPWTETAGDKWSRIADYSALHDTIHEGARIFAATGRGSLPSLAPLKGRAIFLRLIDAPDSPFPYQGGRFIVARGPFSVEAETALFKKLAIDWLLVKNAGGANSYTKIQAARNLGLPVAILDQPPLPAGARVFTDVKNLLDWVASQTK